MKKKPFFFALSLSLCFVFLFGCEKNDESKKKSSSNPSKTEQISKDEVQKEEAAADENANENVIDLDKKLEDKINKEKEKEEKKIDETKSSLENFPQPKTFDKDFDSKLDKSELNSDLTVETSYKLLLNIPSVSETLNSDKNYKLYVTEGKTTFDGYIAKEEGDIEKNGKLIPLESHLYQIDKLSKDIYHFDLNKNEFVKINDNSKH